MATSRARMCDILGVQINFLPSISATISKPPNFYRARLPDKWLNKRILKFKREQGINLYIQRTQARKKRDGFILYALFGDRVLHHLDACESIVRLSRALINYVRFWF